MLKQSPGAQDLAGSRWCCLTDWEAIPRLHCYSLGLFPLCVWAFLFCFWLGGLVCLFGSLCKSPSLDARGLPSRLALPGGCLVSRAGKGEPGEERGSPAGLSRLAAAVEGAVGLWVSPGVTSLLCQALMLP